MAESFWLKKLVRVCLPTLPGRHTRTNFLSQKLSAIFQIFIRPQPIIIASTLLSKRNSLDHKPPEKTELPLSDDENSTSDIDEITKLMESTTVQKSPQLPNSSKLNNLTPISNNVSSTSAKLTISTQTTSLQPQNIQNINNNNNNNIFDKNRINDVSMEHCDVPESLILHFTSMIDPVKSR